MPAKCIVKRHYETEKSLWEFSPTGENSAQPHSLISSLFHFLSVHHKKFFMGLDDVTVVVSWSHMGTEHNEHC